ncbi:uncharacterized protein LOC125071611 [Vanessa atalanta]|uniref:uncharacterized protein LOC125071611 n=1 Tax=Vanessa atalanta TaxID=42275 RepID=UPI001FCDDE3A|nr:uncharacterized protein LOC125071611 [Vanessa atalanta]
MSVARPLVLSLAALLAALLVAQVAHAAPNALARTRRQLADDNTLQPLDDAASDDQAREKRKLEGVTEAKFGIKNAVLGFVFGKINSLIDSKTRLVESLDRQNIEINKQYGIEAPKGGGLSSLSGIVGQVIGPKLQFLGPKIQAVTGLLGGASGGGGSGHKDLIEYTVQPSVAGYTEQPEFFGYTQQQEGGSTHFAYGERAERARAAPSHSEADRRHPGVRSQQGQPGLPGQPVWTIRVAPHPYH